jgi:hypothetical protein
MQILQRSVHNKTVLYSDEVEHYCRQIDSIIIAYNDIPYNKPEQLYVMYKTHCKETNLYVFRTLCGRQITSVHHDLYKEYTRIYELVQAALAKKWTLHIFTTERQAAQFICQHLSQYIPDTIKGE